MLMQCHIELDGSKAVGMDEITKREYEKNLEQNIDDLVERLKRKSYKPQPSIRVYIHKSNGKLRPLGLYLSTRFDPLLLILSFDGNFRSIND